MNYDAFLNIKGITLGDKFAGRITEAEAIELITAANLAIIAGMGRGSPTPPDTDTKPIDVRDLLKVIERTRQLDK
jgi:hypothetical protein